MKLYMLILFLMVLPIGLARTGIIVDVQGQIASGCVETSPNDSAYDALKSFDTTDSSVEMKFDGELFGAPFLKSINGLEGKSLGNNIFSGWNFWIREGTSLVEPPELAPGWGMGIGDYKIEKSDEIIAVNFENTEYNSDWTVKVAPKKPEYIAFEDLCPHLIVSDIKIDVDGKKQRDAEISGGKIELSPGSKLEIEVELSNHYSSNEIKDVYVKAELDDIDDGDDIDTDANEKDITAGKSREFSLDLDIPYKMDSDSYVLEIIIEADDEKEIRIEYEVDIEKNKHDLKTEIELTKNVISCGGSTGININLLNIGKKDEDGKITITSDSLGIFEEYPFEVEEYEEFENQYNLKIEKSNEKEHYIELEIDYDGRDIVEELILTIEKCPEKTTKEVPVITVQEKKIKSERNVEIIQEPSISPKEIHIEKQDRSYLIMPLILGVAAIVFLVIVMFLIKK